MKKLLITSFAAVAATAAFGQNFNGGPANIPDNSAAGVSVPVNVFGLVGGQSLQSVSFGGLHHTWVGDITIRVIDPSNNTVDLFARPGQGPNSTFGISSDLVAGNSYSWSMTGGDFWAAAATNPIPSGNYHPATNAAGVQVPTSFAVLNAGAAANGGWQVFANDLAGGDTGGWDQVTLHFNPVPEPASMAALGLGVLALLRRRRKA